MTTLRDAIRSPTTRHLLPAVALAAVVEIGLRVVGLPRLSRLLGVHLQLDDGPSAGTGRAELRPGDAARCRAARRVVQAWPWGGEGKCLRLALITGALLRASRPELHIGVARLGPDVVAHAWLGVDGVVLDPTARNYTPLTSRMR